MPAIALIKGYYKTKLTKNYKHFNSEQDVVFKGYSLKSINWKKYAEFHHVGGKKDCLSPALHIETFDISRHTGLH